jgi:DNA-binding MarR family transcriptional regulator
MIQLIGIATLEVFMTARQIQAFRRQLRRLERFIVMQLQQDAQCCGISVAQCHALLEIAEHDSTTVSELAGTMSLDKSTLSRTVDGLVKEGWVERVINPDNRRAQVLSLAPAGKKLSGRIDGQCNDLYRRLLEGLPPEKLAQILTGLEWLGEALHHDQGEGRSDCGAPAPGGSS